MPTVDELDADLDDFVRSCGFAQRGAVVTDLDGTAVHEHEGRVAIPRTVEHGLKELAELGRPLIINSLRFPRSVLATFGRAWCDITQRPIAMVSLNGSLTGQMLVGADGEPTFEEFAAEPLDAGEIAVLLARVARLLEDGLDEILFFFYPRDWRVGEIIWTPSAARVAAVQAKYTSASEVISGGIEALRARLEPSEPCMALLLVDAPDDRLMAYQHAQRSAFFTHAGVDKLSGARRIAERLGVDLAASIGAGDTVMDSFLAGVGLAVVVGGGELPYRGLHRTIHLRDSLALGELFFRLAETHRAVR